MMMISCMGTTCVPGLFVPQGRHGTLLSPDCGSRMRRTNVACRTVIHSVRMLTLASLRNKLCGWTNYFESKATLKSRTAEEIAIMMRAEKRAAVIGRGATKSREYANHADTARSSRVIGVSVYPAKHTNSPCL